MDDASSWYFSHLVLQKNGSQTHPKAIERGWLIIVITHWKLLIRDDDVVESEIPIGDTQIWTIFSHIKQCSSNEGLKAGYAQKISEALSQVRVPQQEHEAIIESIFQGIDMAVAVNPPLEVGVWDITVSRSRDRSLVPAAESALQRLEQLQLIESQVQEAILCPICLRNFNFAAQEEEEEDSTITCLPCSHHFHLHCIVQWLHISHLCPMCRYPMPTDTPQDCIILASLQVPSKE